MRALVLTLWTLTANVAWAESATPAPAAAPAGEEEVVDLDAMDKEEKFATPRPAMATRVPEHEYDLRLLSLPALLVAILMWNVKWRVPPKLPAKVKS